jgi:hypothetical protein
MVHFLRFFPLFLLPFTLFLNLHNSHIANDFETSLIARKYFLHSQRGSYRNRNKLSLCKNQNESLYDFLSFNLFNSHHFVDIIVGDNLHYVGLFGDHVISSPEEAYVAETGRIYNYFRAIENLAIDFDFLLYQAHTDVIADITDSSANLCIRKKRKKEVDTIQIHFPFSSPFLFITKLI